MYMCVLMQELGRGQLQRSVLSTLFYDTAETGWSRWPLIFRDHVSPSS